MELFTLPFEAQSFTQPGGVSMRYGWFRVEGPARGTLMLLNGRREFIEKDFELIAAWHSRGFDVVAFDWRGQGGSGRLLPGRWNYQKCHVGKFEDYRDDLQRFYAAIVKPHQRGPLVLFGHSMGSFIALDWLLHDKPDVRAAILATPMLALPFPTKRYKSTRAYIRLAIRLGLKNRYTLPGERNFHRIDWWMIKGLLTRNRKYSWLIPEWFKKRPDFKTGGVTFGWLDAAIAAVERLRPQLQNLDLPVLVLNAGDDRVTRSNEVREWAERIPRAIIKTYPRARHDIMYEKEEVAAAVWRDIDAFLEPLVPAGKTEFRPARAEI